ncbi:MAG: ISAzo13 family transposase [Actinobacteria bacterium]|nr:ISAzo13 family transposase [Actinomycetota bacterium]MCA1698862.1 ISAzo13 family transposase [Actinomycetota bacterium]
MVDEAAIGAKFRFLAGELNERQRRLWAASEARAAGRGGIAGTARATGMAVDTIRKGIGELESGESIGAGRVRRPGGGRKPLSETDPRLLIDLERLVDEDRRGDPESLLLWTSKSVRHLAGGLRELGHEVEYVTVAKLLRSLGYSLQANVKTREGRQHPDRDLQFRRINTVARQALEDRQPIISIDCKKKELVGDFKNGGREWRPKGEPELVRVHDFKDKQLGKAIPYGVYDIAADQGWVNVGIDHDTAQFAVNSIRGWWEHLGRPRYPQATRLQITADCGGSNGNRTRLWKVELQRLSDEIELEINVSHLPPGTSKWNRIEHRLFSYITMNWRGKPLVSLETIINLIGATTTSTGLEVYARLDDRQYPAKIRVTDAELNAVNLHRDAFHPEWNYSLKPRT